MGLRSFAYGVLASAAYFTNGVLGQMVSYKEPVTGFTFAVTQFDTDTVPGGLTWGYALPANAMTVDATEYIGYASVATPAGGGWFGFSHFQEMTNALLLQAWPYNGQILSGFRYASGYVAPDIYTGNATVTTIYSNINSTGFTWVYRCQNCWSWDYQGAAGSSSTSSGFQLFAWAKAQELPLTPSDPNSNVNQHEYQDIFPGFPASATQASYAQWATKTFPGSGSTPTTTSPGGTAKPTTTSAKTTTTPATTSIVGTPVPTTTYDYIVVGGGAGGIPVADKLSQAGKSVVLIERGPASTGQWGGTMKPAWLQGTSLTRFDVPGLDNEIWNNSAGIACSDVSVMSGCILGGGTAINAGLWWHPPDQDWDVNFPTGWKSTNMAGPVSNVFSRIPGTYIPSADGIDYLPNGYNLIGSALAGAGWQNVTANSVPNSKNRTFTRGPFMYSGSERGGPLSTYLATANARSNFKLMLNTNVRRVHRTGGHITGVEVQAQAAGGYNGVINVTATTGRVILSAGSFGSARVLFRSGIGPQDQLQVVQSSALDGATMINSTSWINLPVGYNLDDHTNTNIVISHPNVTFYNFYDAYVAPIVADTTAYLTKKSGILAKSAPNINPLFFEAIKGSDGVTRQLEWTARCEGSLNEPDANSMTLSQYLGLGGTSRGRATINGALSMSPSTLPYLHSQADIDTVVQGITNVVNILKKVPNLTMLQPTATGSITSFVSGYSQAVGDRTANHWVGTCKMGTDDGRAQTNGVNNTAVVDTNTKVYGTDNLFVVDASIFPGITTGNPSSAIVSVAEMASQKILALAAPSPVAKFGQCGGQSYSGSSVCAAGSTCTFGTQYYWQCL